MKNFLLTICILINLSSFSQTNPLTSKVYSYENSVIESNPNGTVRNIFNGAGSVLAAQSIKVVTIDESKKKIYTNNHQTELFIIVKDGPILFTINKKNILLVRGSIVCLLPGDVLSVANTSKTTVSYYEMFYQSYAPVNKERAILAGGSFFIDWNNIVFKEHDRGGVRQFFNRPTAMFNKFDIHVTTLNTRKKSHDPHTHTDEEIILMLEGNGEMRIANEQQSCKEGDVVYLNSMFLHNITNTGDIPAVYYAIQWN